MDEGSAGFLGGRTENFRASITVLCEDCGAMFSIQALFGKGQRFHELLEASANEAHESVNQLIAQLNSTATEKSLDDLVLTRRKEKRIAERISEELVSTFITDLEREDIEALSHALYKIPKSVEKFAERYNAAAGQVQEFNFGPQVALLEKATGVVVEMVRRLRDLKHLNWIKEQNERLQVVEGEADKLMERLLRDLYSGRYDALKVVIIKDLYELLEKVIDRCRNAGNIVVQIVLKNS